MTSLPLLSLLTLLPLLGIAAIFALARRGIEPQQREKRAQTIALATSLLTLAGAAALFAFFDPANPDFQLNEKIDWLPAFNIAYRRGMDGLSFVFVLLSCVLCPLSILAGFSVHRRVVPFMIAFLALQAMLIGVFTSTDLVLFTFFFEGVLVPMFFVIGIWGGEKRIYAAFKFFLMTFAGSVAMLVALFAILVYAGTSDMAALAEIDFPKTMELALWAAFFFSFAVKTPLWPFHTWLPYAHGEAPTAGSVLLAGILLKMGGYGFIRIGMQILPQGHAYFAPAVSALAAIAIVYASLVAFAQTDFKRLVAYSSVAHMGTAILGLFAGSLVGLQGGVFVMISHGLVAAGLFLGAGVLYDRLHTKELARFGGLSKNMPLYASAFMVLMLASIGLPGTSGFVGEFLTLLGVFQTNGVLAACGALGIVFGAAVMLRLYGLVFSGTPRDEEAKTLPDLSRREIALFLPLIVLVIGIGLYPAPVRALYEPCLAKIMMSVEQRGAR